MLVLDLWARIKDNDHIAEGSDRLVILGVCIGLAAAVIIAFEPVRKCGFVEYDDYQYVVQNPIVKEGLTLEGVKWAFTTSQASNWHPVTWLSHMLDCELFGEKPLGPHVVNVLFHIMNTLLLFYVLYRSAGGLFKSAFVAAIFALHPVHVESVAWVAERKDVLSGLFWLLTMLAYVRYVERPSVRRYVWVFVFLVVGLMAKPMLVTLPAVFLLMDYWPLGRFKEDKKRKRCLTLLIEKVPLFAAAVGSSVVTVLVQGKAKAMSSEYAYGLTESISNALFSYAAYIGKMIYPKDLCVLYPLEMGGVALWKPLFAVGVLLLITWAVWCFRNRREYLVTGWLWYLVTLLPVIGFIQVGVQSMADRYTYLPSIGILIMVVWSAGAVIEKIKPTKVFVAMACTAVIIFMILCTRVQVGFWQNNFTLFGRAIAVTKGNYVMHNNFGLALNKHGKIDEAIEEFEKVLAINPGYIRARANIGHLMRSQNRMDEAIICFTEALRVKEDWPQVHNELGRAYAYKGDYELAIQSYKRAIELMPDNASAYNNWGMVLKDQGKADEALEKFKKAKQLLKSHAQ